VRRVEQEEERHRTFFNDLFDTTISARHRRYPRRKVRPEIWRHFVSRWDREAPQLFRLGFRTDLKDRHPWACEWRLTPFATSRPDDPDWQGHERGIVITWSRAVTNVGGTGIDPARFVAYFSLHALARYIERTSRSDDAALMDGIGVVLHNYDDCMTWEEGQRFEILHPTEGTGWRGFVKTVEIKGLAPHKMMIARTFF
jgi:hypothetical protein